MLRRHGEAEPAVEGDLALQVLDLNRATEKEQRKRADSGGVPDVDLGGFDLLMENKERLSEVGRARRNLIVASRAATQTRNASTHAREPIVP